MAVYKQTVSYEVESLDLYECGRCGENYETEEGAEECCQPSVNEITVYRCPNCERTSTSKKEIINCCTKEILLCVSCKKEVQAGGECCPDLFIEKFKG